MVHLAQWQDDKDQVAVKVMPHDTTRAERANLREVFWLTKLDHKNVVKLKHCYLCLSEMWIVLEFMVRAEKKKEQKKIQFLIRLLLCRRFGAKAKHRRIVVCSEK